MHGNAAREDYFRFYAMKFKTANSKVFTEHLDKACSPKAVKKVWGAREQFKIQIQVYT